MKESFSLRVERVASSKIILFLSFQMAQKIIKGAALHRALAFFLTGKLSQLRRKYLTNKGQPN